MTDFSETALAALRRKMEQTLSPARYAHTLGVERAAARAAEIYCPDRVPLMRAAALLHDCTKEYGDEETAAVLAREGIVLRPDERAAPKILHAITAPPEIVRLHPAQADPVLLSAVRWHTTGRAGMTLCDALLYLADAIEEGRTYPSCAALRERFWGADPARMSKPDRERHLADALLPFLSDERDRLTAKNAPVCLDTLAAIEDLNTRKTF